MLWTTLRVLREHDACISRYKHLREGLPSRFGQDEPIPLLHILCWNGLDDTLWALSAVHPDCAAERDVVARLMAADFADEVRLIYESHIPGNPVLRETLATVRRFARGHATREELVAAREAAWYASDAAWDAAWAARAAWAASAAAGDAAWDAAWAARAAWAASAAAGDAARAAWAASAAAGAATRAAAGAATRAAQGKTVFAYLSGRRI